MPSPSLSANSKLHKMITGYMGMIRCIILITKMLVSLVMHGTGQTVVPFQVMMRAVPSAVLYSNHH